MSRHLLDPAPRANLVWFDEVDSTNDLAARLMTAWIESDNALLKETLVVAGRQSAGRGRGANRWESPPGGLYATWLAWLPLEALATLPMAVGVALAEAVEALLPRARVGMKWPNDLQVKGRKLGGVLCQSRGHGDAAWVLAGFGVNIAGDPALAKGDPVRPTSLHALGFRGEATAACWQLAGGFLAGIRPLLASPQTAISAWVARSVHRRGDAMELRLGAEVVEGRFAGFAPDGQLELEVRGGVRRFASGELIAKGSGPGG